jgi:hypothetical protein
MHFWTLSGSTELDLTIMDDGSTNWSKEGMQSGIDRINRTLQCRNFTIFLELSDAVDGVMGIGWLGILIGV